MFKAKAWLNDWLLEQEVYQNILNSDKNKKLLPLYLDEAERRSEPTLNINQGTIVKSIIDQKDLCSRAIAFHEMVEIEVYLAKGCTPEEVANWTAHDKLYEFAHNIAERYHLGLIHDSFKEYSGVNLPLEIIIMTQPSLQQLDPNFQFVPHRISQYGMKQPAWKIHEGQYEEIKFDYNQIKESIELFIIFGGVYNDSNFAEKAQQAMSDTVKRENQRNRFYSELAIERKSKPAPTSDLLYL